MPCNARKYCSAYSHVLSPCAKAFGSHKRQWERHRITRPNMERADGHAEKQGRWFVEGQPHLGPNSFLEICLSAVCFAVTSLKGRIKRCFCTGDSESWLHTCGCHAVSWTRLSRSRQRRDLRISGGPCGGETRVHTDPRPRWAQRKRKLGPARRIAMISNTSPRTQFSSDTGQCFC